MSVNLKFRASPENLKPIINYGDHVLLFDTGADTPVWCGGVKSFEGAFPKAVPESCLFILSGFGRSEKEIVNAIRNPKEGRTDGCIVDVYKIPEFKLESGGQCITWKGLPVAVTEHGLSGVDMVLPCTMFRGMILRICHNRKAMEIEVISPKAVVDVKTVRSTDSIGEILHNICTQDDIGEVIESLDLD